MKKLLSILALALCFVACQNEGVENATNGDLVDVVLTVDAPELGVTRADGDADSGKNSAFGAIDFFNDADWANYDVRYILEVYNANDDGTGEPIYRERLANYLDKYAPTQFELRLVPNREYKFVVFADFVAQGTQDDLYYDTTDLRNITAKTDVEDWDAMKEARDAYFVTENVNVTTGLNKTLTLTRPFGKLRVIATDLDYIAGYSAPGYVEIKYHTEALYKSFNAVNGNLNEAQLTGDELVYGFDVKKDAPYTEGYDAEAKNQTLFADYLYAREGQQIPVNFEMSVYESKGGRLIKTTDFNTQIPVQRNHLTTIIGDLLTTQANITIIVNDNFDDEMINPSMEVVPAAPAVTATVEANTITIAWEAIDGAVKYFARNANDSKTFEETTELTMVYESLAWETEYTFEVYAVNEKGIVSETTVVKATTEAKPITYNIYLENKDNWEAVYFYAWGDYTTSEWPGEAMTKTTVDEVEYYVYTLPSEVNGKTINFLFNNGGNGKQTADIKDVVVDKNYFYNNYVEAPAVDTILYLQPNTNWKVDNARFAAYFFGNGETWVDATLVEGETDIYAVTVPSGFVDIIFCRMNPNATDNNWNNKWNQTADLKVPTDGTNLYTVKENTWDNGGGTWSVYTPAVVEPTEPVALATPVVEASVEGNVVTLTWEAIEGAAHYTVQVDDDLEEVVEATDYKFTGDYEVEYMFTIKAIAADTEKNLNSEACVVKATTEAEPQPEIPVAGSELTVEQFLTLANTENDYVLTGKITRVVHTSYGNFDLTDATGTIYVYGLLTPDGTAQKQWAAAGLHEGDTITIKGKYSLYNNDPQIKNATYVSHVAAPFIEAEPIAINATDLAASIEVKSNVAWAVTCDADWVTSYTTSGENNGSIDIVATENTDTNNRTANFTLSAEGAETITVTLTQYGAGATDTKGTYTSEDFFENNSVSSNSKATFEKVNINGTTYDCLKLGTSSAVGKYTSNAVNESGNLTLSFYAVGWNGKTSKLNVYLDGKKIGDTITLTSNSGAANNTPYTITPSDSTDYYTLSLTGVTESSTITFETISGAPRAIIFGVQLY